MITRGRGRSLICSGHLATKAATTGSRGFLTITTSSLCRKEHYLLALTLLLSLYACVTSAYYSPDGYDKVTRGNCSRYKSGLPGSKGQKRWPEQLINEALAIVRIRSSRKTRYLHHAPLGDLLIEEHLFTFLPLSLSLSQYFPSPPKHVQRPKEQA